MSEFFRKMRWCCFAGEAILISAWVMDHSGVLYQREHFKGDCFIGEDMDAWHPTIFIGLLLVMASAVGFVVQNDPNRNKELVG